MRDGEFPSLSLIPFTNAKLTLNQPNRLIAEINSDSPYVTYWTLTREGNDSVLAINTSLGKTSLLIPPNILRAGLTHDFTVKVMNHQGSSSATTELLANTIPCGGNFSISPDQGAALQTVFSLTLTGWRDEDLPLQYQFVLCDPWTGESQFLTSISLANVYQGVIGKLNPQKRELLIEARVYDSYLDYAREVSWISLKNVEPQQAQTQFKK